jgi:hypothetical protein
MKGYGRNCSRLRVLLVGLTLTAAQSIAWAGTIVPCDGDCTWSIAAGGVQVRSGEFQVDPTTGDIDLGAAVQVGLGGGAWARIDDVSGNADPVLGFHVTANTGTNGRTFAFTFSLPIALAGTIEADSQVSYALKALTAAGAQITPLRTHVVVAQEIDSTPGGLAPLNKGVDIGDRFFVTTQTANPVNSPAYTATNRLTGNLAYDLMSVTLGFTLSPNSNAVVSGSVQQTIVEQTPVPLPAGVWLLGSALLGWSRLGRSRRAPFAVTASV